MDHTDIGFTVFTLAAAGFVLASVFNFFQNTIGIIGAGTALSLGLNGTRWILDRRENDRRKRMDRVQTLKPVVYNPLLKWASSSQKALQFLPENEFYVSSIQLTSPPDYSGDGDYIALVGEHVKSIVGETIQAHEGFVLVRERLKDEYMRRLDELLRPLGFRDGGTQPLHCH